MLYLGIDLGGTNIATGLCDEEGKILGKVSVKTNAGRPAEEIAKDMAETCRMVCEKLNVKLEDVACIGIGSPGGIDPVTGTIRFAGNLNFHNVPMPELVGGLTGRPTACGNDANVAAMGEVMVGGARGAKNAVLFTLGTGVGGGIVINGDIYAGTYGTGGELGHICLVHNGLPCTCGRKGCLEAYASAGAFVRQSRAAMEENKDTVMWELCGGDIEKCGGRTAFDAMRKGDKVGTDVVNTYIGYLAEGVADVINIFEPEVVLIGGGLSNEGEYLLAPLREKVYSVCFGARTGQTPTRIERAQLGNDAGIIGAAMFGRHWLENRKG